MSIEKPCSVSDVPSYCIYIYGKSGSVSVSTFHNYQSSLAFACRINTLCQVTLRVHRTTTPTLPTSPGPVAMIGVAYDLQMYADVDDHSSIVPKQTINKSTKEDHKSIIQEVWGSSSIMDCSS